LNPLKKLAGQTVIYGLSSIVPRFLSFFLVPLYTHVFAPAEYGVVGDLYSMVVILNIILIYGMETGYFWFSKNETDTDKVYSTSLISLIFTSGLFFALTFIFSQSIANSIEYPNHPEYVWWFGIIIAVDSICAIPFVKLRKENKAFRFAFAKLFSVILNVILNVLFIIVFPWLLIKGFAIPKIIYNPEVGVGYIFISNIISSVCTLFFLIQDFKIKFTFDFSLWKRMMKYAFPLLIAGLAGGINDAIDRQFLKYMLPANVDPMYQLGIYFANIKIAVILVVFIQTFRFAAEPFFFNYEKEKDSKQIFADIMKYFSIFCFVIFLLTLGNLSFIKYFNGKAYWDGLNAVPVVLLSNVFVGIYINLSIWYKISGKTKYGAYIILIGSAITIIINYLFVPVYGYMASAYARLICYFIMILICYVLGQKNYKIPYDVRSILVYFALTMLLLLPIYFTSKTNAFIQLAVNNILILLFVLFILKKEQLLPRVLTILKIRK
jgi:O-antigen/teichoic acid export membrane protein